MEALPDPIEEHLLALADSHDLADQEEADRRKSVDPCIRCHWTAMANPGSNFRCRVQLHRKAPKCGNSDILLPCAVLVLATDATKVVMGLTTVNRPNFVTGKCRFVWGRCLD